MFQIQVCEAQDDKIQAQAIKRWAKVQYKLQFLIFESVYPGDASRDTSFAEAPT